MFSWFCREIVWESAKGTEPRLAGENPSLNDTAQLASTSWPEGQEANNTWPYKDPYPSAPAPGCFELIRKHQFWESEWSTLGKHHVGMSQNRKKGRGLGHSGKNNWALWCMTVILALVMEVSIQGHTQLHSAFKASLGYRKPCPNSKQKFTELVLKSELYPLPKHRGGPFKVWTESAKFPLQRGDPLRVQIASANWKESQVPSAHWPRTSTPPFSDTGLCKRIYWENGLSLRFQENGL